MDQEVYAAIYDAVKCAVEDLITEDQQAQYAEYAAKAGKPRYYTDPFGYTGYYTPGGVSTGATYPGSTPGGAIGDVSSPGSDYVYVPGYNDNTNTMHPGRWYPRQMGGPDPRGSNPANYGGAGGYGGAVPRSAHPRASSPYRY